MRSWISAAVAISAVGMVAPSAVRAAPATGQTAIERSAAGASSIEDIRYVVRCHRVRVWRNTPHGRRLVVVRRCHRHYY